jgi:hypothetical protein
MGRKEQRLVVNGFVFFFYVSACQLAIVVNKEKLTGL